MVHFQEEIVSANGLKIIILSFCENDVMKCSICNERDERCLQIHHKDINHKNNSLDNLIIVCSNCHLKIHNRYNGDNIKKLMYRIKKSAADEFDKENKSSLKKRQNKFAEQFMMDEILPD